MAIETKKRKGVRSLEVTDTDREEIARLIKEGFTSGLLNCDGYEISWALTTSIVR